MFDGEYASLNAIYSTKCVRVPKPIKVRTSLHLSTVQWYISFAWCVLLLVFLFCF